MDGIQVDDPVIPCAVVARMARDELVWLERTGIGYLRVTGNEYDDSYFAKYEGYAATPMGRELNEARLALVARHYQGPLVDIGIGSGQFVESRPETFGYDVNPLGVEWLQRRGLFADPYAKPVEAACFWDSLEHISDPGPLLANIRRFVFVAIPIFRDLAHVLRSKHYRPSEHALYFTMHGFLEFMTAHGFRCLEINGAETQLGREDIVSFAFARGN